MFEFTEQLDEDPEADGSRGSGGEGAGGGPGQKWYGFTFKSNSALKRLSIGTWGRGGTLRFYKNPFEDQAAQLQAAQPPDA